MMSKKQFACMLTLHLVYLLVGASIFYHIESPLELSQRADEKLERLEIQNLLYENYLPDDPSKQNEILSKLSEYCGKSMFNFTTEDEEPPYKWDFYHSFFFSYTVVSTIGYGNLAPTTHLSRILMIFYALFGIPINGILLANLGEIFGMQLISVIRKYKRKNAKRANNLNYFFHNLGMLGQLFLYLVPGFLFFIFLPACIFVVFEKGWDYVGAVYYAFVTLTTIGFGDLVAGTVNNGFSPAYYIIYEIFLIVWITFGLGYIVMLLGFITSGMRSEGVHKIEQKLANQLKTTQNKILQGFTKDIAVIRKIINEANLIKLKPVYVEAAPYLYRSESCPILTYDVEPRDLIVKRRRANSENIHLSAKDFLRIQSDTDLLGIDKEKTFSASAIVKPAELLARVVNVLGGLEQQNQEKGVHMFDDKHILASEKPPMFSIGQDILTNSPKKVRALSVAVPNYRKESIPNTDYNVSWKNDEIEKKDNSIRAGKLSLPTNIIPEIPLEQNSEPRSFLSKLFGKQSTSDNSDEFLKSTTKDKTSIAQTVNENVKTKRRGSIFPTFNVSNESKEDDNKAKEYQEKTQRGRRSIFPTFDFSEEEDNAAIKSYLQKNKRHSIFPTFDFSEEEDDAATSYKEKTRSGRHSIFPTFDFSESDEDTSKKYKESTKRGRKSIFPTFDFSNKDKDEDDDTLDEEEVQKYQNRTKKGRLSLFPTFGKNKKNDSLEEDDTIKEDSDEIAKYQSKTSRGRLSLFPTFGKNKNKDSNEKNDSAAEDSEELARYHKKTSGGRLSLFPTFGKDRKNSSPRESSNDLEASIRQFQKRLGLGSSNDTDFSSDLENYRNKTKQGRKSLFDSDVNLSSLPETEQVEVLEQTSVADLLRALTVLETVSQSPRGSFDSSGLLGLIAEPPAVNNRRRGSLRPDFILPSIPSRDTEESSGPRRRRVSVRGAAPQFTPTLATVVAGSELQTTAAAARENRMSMLNQPPPPYSETNNEEESLQTRIRRYSPAPGGPGRPSTGPVPRLFSRIRKESVASVEEEEESTSRRGSLAEVVIDKNKDSS